MRFTDRVALITGSGQGLGLAFAHALAEEGARIVVLDADPDTARAGAAALEARGFDALAAPGDVTDEARVAEIVGETRERFGRLDILVNNAALHRRKYNQTFASLTLDEVRQLLDVNVVGVLNCAQACRPLMAAGGGGVIVNIASTSANASCTPYGVSKLAALGLTNALATELAPDRIRVNAISPGFVGSAGMLAEQAPENLRAMLAALGERLPDQVVAKCTPEDLAALVMHQQLLEREGTMDDVVRTLLFLCSDDAGFLTGEVLKVAGGSGLGF